MVREPESNVVHAFLSGQRIDTTLAQEILILAIFSLLDQGSETIARSSSFRRPLRFGHKSRCGYFDPGTKRK